MKEVVINRERIFIRRDATIQEHIKSESKSKPSNVPVALIPEELLVSSVGNDVVNISCFDILSFLHALNAEGMCLEVTLAGLLPRSAIAAPCRRPHLLWVLWLVYLAVLLSVGHKGSAARVTAGCVRSGRHDAHASQGRPIFPK